MNLYYCDNCDRHWEEDEVNEILHRESIPSEHFGQRTTHTFNTVEFYCRACGGECKKQTAYECDTCGTVVPSSLLEPGTGTCKVCIFDRTKAENEASKENPQ